VVLSVDADELLRLEPGAVERFWASEAVVASFDCVNYTYLNLVCGKPDSPLVARKPFAFKRAAVSAEHHLDYLWLVGVEQAAVASDDFLPEALCAGAHLTTVRSSFGASIKFGFYNCLYFHLQGGGSLQGSFREAQNFFAKGRFSRAAQAWVYSRAMPDAIGFPNQQFFRRADPQEVPEEIRRLAEETVAPYNGPLPHRCLSGSLIPGVPLYALMRPGPGLRVYLSFGCEARLRVMPLVVDGPPLQLERPALERRWSALALRPEDVPVDMEVSGERIGDLVELVVWSSAADLDAWARASLTPQFSLQVAESWAAGS
jgi:hypothetical protein